MYTSAPSLEEAKKIANELVSSKLAACVNIIPKVISVFEWEGKIDNSDEFLLMIKVSYGFYTKIEKQFSLTFFLFFLFLNRQRSL
jgi:periplasmic divalent cation tolerance protein